MPTYEYECTACGRRFEEFQSMKDAPIKKCPKCGKLKVRRLISAGAGLIFKGSGFYITDYKSKSPSKDSKDSEPAAKKPDDRGGDSKEKSAKDGGDAAKPAEKAAEKPASTEKPAPPSAKTSSSKPGGKKKS